jgi:hypothetical protein
MANTSVPLNIDAVEQLIKEGTRLIEVTRPVWQEVSKLAAKIPPRRYLPIAAGLAAVGLLGVVAATSARRRKATMGPRRVNVVEMKPETKPIDVEAVLT